MDTIRCLIIDDEPLSRDILKTYIADHESLELVGECVDALEAGKMLRTENIQLIFLDINMPKISGISFYKGLTEKPSVIFTTAYPNYAVEGFELNAVDYLVKPFGFDRFYTAVEKVFQKHGGTNSATIDYITVKVDKRLFKVAISDILYIESIGDYAKIHTNDKVLITSETLKGYEATLPSNIFIRIHKSYIVSLTHVNYLEGNQISIKDAKLPLGKAYRENVRKKFI
ncbi:MAG: LytTR family DNA-binding domain-containing protein [Bacteroidota bacterium]